MSASFSGPQSGSDVETFLVVGNIQKIVIDVSVAYTGAQSTCHLLLDQFGFYILDPTNTVQRTSFLYVNLKVAGTRTITPTGVINAQTGDNLDAISGWIMSGFMSTDRHKHYWRYRPATGRRAYASVHRSGNARS